MKKSIVGMLFVMVLVICNGCSMGYTSDEPCKWCNSTPTKKFETSNGEDCYICENHTHTCAICNKKFDKELKHYTNLLGAEAFACDDCYQDITQQ